MTSDCPICLSESAIAFTIADYEVLECSNCRHQFCDLALGPEHVSKTYGDDYFYGGGAGYPDYTAEADLLRNHGRRYGDILSRYMPCAQVLDVGCAAGFILQGFIDRGWRGMGIEPNAHMAAYARDTFDLEVHHTSLEAFQADMQFDVVSLVQVIGHFFQLNIAMQAVAKLVKPNGYCIIEYWDRDSWMARLMGKNWHEYSPPSVLNWFTPTSLDILFESNGFHNVAHGKPKKYIMGAHAKSLLDHKLRELPLGAVTTQGLKLIPDQLRIRYPAFDLGWRLYQKKI